MSAASLTEPSAPQALPRAFWALWVCQLVNRLGSFVQPFLVLYLTQDRHLSAGTAGAVAAAVGAGTVASQPVGGWLADRVGRRLTMLICFFGTGAALIGRIGTSTDYFFVGDDRGAIRVRSSGRLFLGINDDYLQDNTGVLRDIGRLLSGHWTFESNVADILQVMNHFVDEDRLLRRG